MSAMSELDAISEEDLDFERQVRDEHARRCATHLLVGNVEAARISAELFDTADARVALVEYARIIMTRASKDVQ